MDCWNRTFLVCCVLVLAMSTGCGVKANSPSPSAEVQLSDEVLSLLRENDTKTAAVKAHQKESGLTLSEAKQQVEEVIERDGIVIGKNP